MAPSSAAAAGTAHTLPRRTGGRRRRRPLCVERREGRSPPWPAGARPRSAPAPVRGRSRGAAACIPSGSARAATAAPTRQVVVHRRCCQAHTPGAAASTCRSSPAAAHWRRPPAEARAVRRATGCGPRGPIARGRAWRGSSGSLELGLRQQQQERTLEQEQLFRRATQLQARAPCWRWCEKREWQAYSRLLLIRCCFRCSPPGFVFCKLRQEGAHTARLTAPHEHTGGTGCRRRHRRCRRHRRRRHHRHPRRRRSRRAAAT